MTGQEIKAKLKEKNIRQADLCRAWKEPKSTISMLVNRKLKSAALEKKLARRLGVSVEELRALPTPEETINSLQRITEQASELISSLERVAGQSPQN